MFFRNLASQLYPNRFPLSPLQDSDKSHIISAIVLNRHGDADVLEYVKDFPGPIARTNTTQVSISIHAAGINPVDFKLRKYIIPEFLYPLPKIPGTDFAGIVKKAPIGSRFAPGDRVFGMLSILGSEYGSYAEECCVEENYVAKAPDNISLEELASFPLVGCTIIQAMKPVIKSFHGNLKGKKCFIQAGSGGVGVFAIQYCANVLGMYVSTTCSPRNFDLMQKLGASEVIDYKNEKIEDRIVNYDVFIDTMGYINEELVLRAQSKILNKTGPDDSHYIRVASSPYDENLLKTFGVDKFKISIPETRLDKMVQGRWKEFYYRLISSSKIKYHFVVVEPERNALEEIAAAIERCQIQAVVQEVLPLKEAARGHKILESGHVTGKLILKIQNN